MLEKWKLIVDKDNFFGTLLTELSRAFDCFIEKVRLLI